MSEQRRFKAQGSARWGEGKVHRYLYSYENKVWYVACRSPYKNPFGGEVDPSTPVTCRKCGIEPVR